MVTVTMIFKRLSDLFFDVFFAGDRVRSGLSLYGHRSFLWWRKYFFDAFVNQASVLFQVEFLVIAHRWSNRFSALNFRSYISELGDVWML